MSEQDTSTTGPELIFEEPPPPGKTGRRVGGSPFGRWLNSLRQHPGRWAKYPKSVNSDCVSAVRGGKSYGVKPGEFEVALRNTNGARGDLYARYVGEESAS